MISRIEDREGDKVNYVEWLAKLGVDVRPGDITGLSTQIYNSHNTEMDKRYNDQIMRCVSICLSVSMCHVSCVSVLLDKAYR